MTLISMSQKKFILSIAGHDPTNAAGTSIDLLVANEFNMHCLSAISNLTVQDAKKLHKIEELNAKLFKKNLKNLNNNFKISGIKIGALSSTKIIETTANFLSKIKQIPLIIDPIVSAGGGGNFLNKKDKDFALQNLYPLATLLTPNIYELNALSGSRNEDDSVKKLLDLGINKIYVTGKDVKKEIINRLYIDGKLEFEVKTTKINKKIRGTGCALSTSILCSLIKTNNLIESCSKANKFLEKRLKNSIYTGYQEFINFK